jgi:preprotein translocase subunit SecE
MARQDQASANSRQGVGRRAAIAEQEYRVSDMASDDKNRESEERPSAEYSPSVAAEPRRGFFDIYKPGQGHRTRVWSAVSFGALACWFAYFVYAKLVVIQTGQATKLIRVGVLVGIILVFGLLGYWLLALNRKVCDFLIATEGEMKKVNWTTRKDIIGSTKVVIFVMIGLTVILFGADLFFTQFFRWIGVLR